MASGGILRAGKKYVFWMHCWKASTLESSVLWKAYGLERYVLWKGMERDGLLQDICCLKVCALQRYVL